MITLFSHSNYSTSQQMKSLLSNSTLHRTLICSLLRDGTYFALKRRQNCWYQLYLKLELKHKETFRTSEIGAAGNCRQIRGCFFQTA